MKFTIIDKNTCKQAKFPSGIYEGCPDEVEFWSYDKARRFVEFYGIDRYDIEIVPDTFEFAYLLKYEKTVPNLYSGESQTFPLNYWSPSLDIHLNRLQRLNDGIAEGWISNVKEEVYVKLKVSEREL
jgi:hypothetical protein